MIRNIGIFLLAFLMTFVFLLSGIVVNILQLILYVTLYNTNRCLYRKINYYMVYTVWTQILAMCEWWSNSRCNLYIDEESSRHFGKEHSIVIMNHKYDVDWLMCWFVCEKLRVLGNSRACMKKSLSRVPIVGWGWSFAEMIFLERNWDKDKPILGEQLNKLVEYEDPMMILYFCEGTRFTPEKYQASMEFAKARNLPHLKHHLCPRTSGFNFSVTHLKNKIAAIYNLQIGFPETSAKPTFSNMLRGHSFTGDIYVQRIPVSEIPTDSDEATSKWLYQLYQEKDKLMDGYLKTNEFPGKCVRLHRSYRTLLNSIFWVIVVGIPFLYFLFQLLTTGNFWVTSVTVSVILMVFSSMYLMVRVTKAAKGSSYGRDKSPVKSKNECENHNDSPLQAKDSENHKGIVHESATMDKNGVRN